MHAFRIEHTARESLADLAVQAASILQLSVGLFAARAFAPIFWLGGQRAVP